MARDVGVIIVAAGSGSRTGSTELKQFRWVAGKPMLLHSIQTFQARADVAMVVCVLPREYVGDPPPWIFQSDAERLLVSVGGRHRSESVANGLEDLPVECEIVVIHDAARPLVSPETIARVIEEARKGNGAIAALPVADTLKRADAAGQIQATEPREHLWQAQTPQMFRHGLLLHALGRTGMVTDEAGAVEALGLKPKLVQGSTANLKITYAEDLQLAEIILASQGRQT